ncbi:OmpA family protein [Maliponia aquimaris]|uniref:Putative outer membrane lipoprotein n=1 Tax=Maliponia aquimaris TaxID=1673631 RepID=A0A238JZJ2_9RHOB|nr:OmpA family protein [Maliponia aquimaris]SMX36071.1 putative outer membrane lipoprotein [Maliponia aquimaris]
MKPSRLMISAGVMSLVLGGQATAQEAGALDAEQLQQLRLFQQVCAVGGTPPTDMDCDAIARALEAAGEDAGTDLGAKTKDKNKKKDKKKKDGEPKADEITADDLRDKLTPPVEALDPEPTAEIPARPPAETPKPDVAETPVSPPAEAPQPDVAANPPVTEAPDPQPTAVLPAAPEPEALDPQAQADALQRLLQAPAAAAAAGRGDGEKVEETVDRDDVRRSSEDFDTTLTGEVKKKDKKKKKADKDDGGIDPLAGVALLGLGALVLDHVLSDGGKVVSNSGDRVVVEDPQGQVRVLRNDDVLLRRPGAEVSTIRFDDGSTRNIVTYEDGTVVETIRAADGRVLRRSRLLPGGDEVVLFDDTQTSAPVQVDLLPAAPDRSRVDYRNAEAEELARALQARNVTGVNRTFSLAQIRNIDAVRHLVPEITVDTITFETNSAAIRAEQAEQLATLGNALRNAILRNPGEVFLIEGHTDAAGGYAYNLALSDRRAESVALALTEYFDVPPENMVLQGYGESDLLIPTQEAERANRRAAVRRITPLLNGW